MRRLVMTLGLLTAFPLAPGAATIVIINQDGANEGFNDPTVVAPVGGNPGTTLGQQRLNVFQAAANIWGALIPSNVTIRVQAQFNPQACDATSAVLGSAGPIQVFRDFAGAETPATWYHVALANKLANVDLSASNDISATFNSDLDNAVCLGTTDWYYGLDGNEGTDIELLPVVLHELGHGLGFSTLVNLTTGVELMGFDDIYETFIRDNSSGLNWNVMTNGQRSASAVNTGNVVWSGPVATAASPCFLGGTPTMYVNSPPALPPTIPIGSANFGPALTETGVTGNIVLVDDGTGTTTDACEALINGPAVSGNIALIDRGTCTFVSKAQRAQAAGAVAVIIADNVAAATPPALGGTDPSIVIPVVSVTQADGNAIKAQLGGGVNVTLRLNPDQLAGADAANRVKLYAPNPVQGGSSISHWDVSASPNLLMEPAINSNLSDDVDLTLAHFSDIGWLDDCLTASCPPDTMVPPGTAVNLDFCVTNCGTSGNITVTVSDTAGWCPPSTQTVSILNGQTTCFPITCTTPDTCDTVMTKITFIAKTAAGFADTCMVTITSKNTPPVADCRNAAFEGGGGPGCSVSVTPSQVDFGSFDPDGGPVSLTLVPPGPFSEGVTPYMLIATDDCGASDTCQATITVTCPAAVLDLEPPVITFTTVALGDTVCDSVCVINTGTAQLDVTSITGCDTDGFFVDLSGFDNTIAPGDTSKFQVCFSPTPSGPDTCTLTVNSNGGTGQVTVEVGEVSAVLDPGGAVFRAGPIIPTPFFASAQLRFSLPGADGVRVDVFDFQGRLVRTLVAGERRPAGEQSVTWDGRDERGETVGGGVYFVRIRTDSHGSKVVRAVRLN